MTDLASQVLAGSRRALARLLTLVENDDAAAATALMDLFPHTGHAWVIGITGAPGTGKSSLVNALAGAYRQQGRSVSILAVDPTSPFSGGAILGDRIRMRDLSGDPGVFIRSMATRGSLGGLAQAARDAIRVMDAAGFDIVLVETVGAGQSEVDIVRTAQTTIVVEAPGLGDDVQAIKAGILEIADVLVVNKADRPGAQNTVRALRAMLELGHPGDKTRLRSHHGRMMTVEPAAKASTTTDIWLPPVLMTVATGSEADSGVMALRDAVEAHRAHLTSAGQATAIDHRRLEIELTDRLRTAIFERFLDRIPEGRLNALIDRIQTRSIDPRQAVSELLAEYAPD